eukprot:TRINITY_DN2281_c0_g1_i5.p3 TRINITY_DN2281_c0_g1~~TRINITY_DN2281_c0_g1_i5.p3  ORF type:complete len:117 (+),score=4.15 TRINITY_DN2281_c0_g1_i5:295-645(+)
MSRIGEQYHLAKKEPGRLNSSFLKHFSQSPKPSSIGAEHITAAQQSAYGGVSLQHNPMLQVGLGHITPVQHSLLGGVSVQHNPMLHEYVGSGHITVAQQSPCGGVSVQHKPMLQEA